jgi:hypothetical protein
MYVRIVGAEAVISITCILIGRKDDDPVQLRIEGYLRSQLSQQRFCQCKTATLAANAHPERPSPILQSTFNPHKQS